MINIREELNPYQQQFETIEAPERILSLLKPVIGNEASMKITVDHGDELFHTVLLDINFSRKLLTLKKIKYTFGHLMVIDATKLPMTAAS